MTETNQLALCREKHEKEHNTEGAKIMGTAATNKTVNTPNCFKSTKCFHNTHVLRKKKALPTVGSVHILDLRSTRRRKEREPTMRAVSSNSLSIALTEQEVMTCNHMEVWCAKIAPKLAINYHSIKTKLATLRFHTCTGTSLPHQQTRKA